jgi:hypothetical protein
MLLELRKHDGKTEEIEVLRAAFAREIATSLDWDSERRRFELLEVSEEDCQEPCIVFTDNAGRTLEFGPNSDESFWIVYRYSILKSSFGFFPVSHVISRELESSTLDLALDLLEKHYAGNHEELLEALPADGFEEEVG